MSKLYGFQSGYDSIDIEPVIGGTSPVISEEYQRPHPAVRVHDKLPDNNYVLPAEKALERAERIENHSPPSAFPEAATLVQEIREAAEEAERMYEAEHGGSGGDGWDENWTRLAFEAVREKLGLPWPVDDASMTGSAVGFHPTGDARPVNGKEPNTVFRAAPHVATDLGLPGEPVEVKRVEDTLSFMVPEATE